MRQLKLLPGTMLLMLASTLSINPVSAQQTPASGTGETPNQIDTNTPQTPSRTNTQPAPTPMQMENNPSAPSSTPMQMERQAAPSSTETSINTVTGTVKSVEGQVVTLEMADGMTKQMRVSNADLQRLNLREGMAISATVDAQSVASNITLAQASTPTGAEATSTQTDTNSTTNEAAPSTTTEVDDTSTTPTTTTESTPANRPVRALW